MKHNAKRGILASVGALVTAAALALGGSVAATADPGTPGNPPASTEVTIQKTATPPGGTVVGTGEEAAGLNGIAGSQFTLTLIQGTDAGGDTSTLTNEGQLAAQGRSVNDNGDVVGGELSSTTHVSNVTGGDGVATFTPAEIPAGQYLVSETQTADGVTVAAPFLLTVPLTDPEDRTQWLDHIYVYPKATTFNATKTVNEGGFRKAGDTITWSVAIDAPTLSAGQLNSFVITDQLAEDLALEGAPSLSFENSDTTLSTPNDWSHEVGGNNELAITFTSAGLAKLAAAGTSSGGDTVNVQLSTTVGEEAGALPTTITNTANVAVNGDEVDSTPATINFGEIVVDKQGDDGRLAGAAFDLYAVNPSDDGAQPIASGVTTDSGDQLTFPGLLRSDFVGGGLIAQDSDEVRSFWLVETQAPDGYQLLPSPIEVNLLDDQEVVTIENASTSGGFELPLTGGTGTVLLTVFGALLLAAVLYVAYRRRSAE